MRMKVDRIASGKRKAVNLSLDTGVVEAARAAGLNLSQECEAALNAALRREGLVRQREANRAWAESVTAWVETHGLPLERYRLF